MVFPPIGLVGCEVLLSWKGENTEIFYGYFMLPTTPCVTIVHSTAVIMPCDVSSCHTKGSSIIKSTQPSPSLPLPHVYMNGTTSNMCCGHDCWLLTSGKVSLTSWALVPECWNLTRGRCVSGGILRYSTQNCPRVQAEPLPCLPPYNSANGCKRHVRQSVFKRLTMFQLRQLRDGKYIAVDIWSTFT